MFIVTRLHIVNKKLANLKMKFEMICNMSAYKPWSHTAFKPLFVGCMDNYVNSCNYLRNQQTMA